MIPSIKTNRMKSGILLASLLVFMVFFLLNESIFTKQPNTSSQSQDAVTLEHSLKTALEKMAGVGEVELFFYTGMNEPQQTVTEKPSFALFDQTTNEQKTIQSVLVVATGADQAKTRIMLKEYLAAVLLLPEHRIVVVPMDEKGVSK
ncbi:hypothetical protein HMPREF1210_00449 [Paenisporosarcina sp. HGH0030]|uniref:hypothetical protein n=2 Tax=unclassified Paenisporosarcina TaxID=2642018 RepID=UPI00034E6602|nr:hypothetical protein [Paenisporosarcina sp. HGH0030]EPD53626.1 hypothetical protein HMPREF1210_00449 [Paenisporosarcina sp. HGH0030]